MSQSLKTTPSFGRFPLEAHFNKRHYSKCVIIIDKSKGKCCYHALFPLTCYVIMSMPGTVNIKVSKKDTEDGQKIFRNKNNDLLPQKLGASVAAGSP